MQTNGGHRQVTLGTVIGIFQRRNRLILWPTLVLAVASAFYAVRIPERFRAQSLLAAQTMGAQTYVRAALPTGMGNIQDHLRLVREVLYSQPLLETVVREFRLYSFQGAHLAEQDLEHMKSKVRVEVEGPDSFYIGFQGEDRRRVTEVANRLAGLFVERGRVLQAHRAEEASGFIQTEVERIRSVLTAQEEKVKRYKNSAAAALPEHLASNLKVYETLMGRIQETTEKTANEQARRVAALHEIEALEKRGVPQAEEKSPAAARLDELHIKLKELQARYTDEHPEVTRAQKEIQDLEKAPPVRRRKGPGEPNPTQLRYLELKAEKEAIDQRLDSYQREHQGLSSEFERYRGRVASAPGLETTLTVLMRDYENTRTQYEALLQKQQEARLAEQMEKRNQGLVYRIVEPASLPPLPLIPRRIRAILLGIFAGLGFGVLLAFIAEQMDASFDDVEEFHAFTNLPVLAIIPSLPDDSRRSLPARNAGNGTLLAKPRREMQARPLVTLNSPDSIASEQYNLLALKVQRQFSKNGSTIVLVTSAAGGEGKTITSINLAVALSHLASGRVLLVDADLRKPAVHQYLGLDVQRGLSDLLVKPQDSPDGYVCKVNGLYVLPGSVHRLIPVSVLSSQNVAPSFARLRSEFEFIVLDSPPVVPVADSHLLAGLSDGVVFVARARRTSRELLQRAVESLGVANLAGVVLNDVEFSGSPYARAYEYYEKHYMSKPGAK